MNRLWQGVFSAALGVALLAGVAQAGQKATGRAQTEIFQAQSETEKVFQLYPGADSYGNDLKTLKRITSEQCENACADLTTCKAFTYNTRAAICFLKSEGNILTPVGEALSGRMTTFKYPGTTAKPQVLPFVSDENKTQATNFQALVEATPHPAFQSPGDLRLALNRAIRIQQGETPLAHQLPGLGQDTAEAYLLMAYTGISSAVTGMEQNSLPAALLAFAKARTTGAQAEALMLTGAILGKSGDNARAFEAFAMAAKFYQGPGMAEALKGAEKLYAIKITGYSLDSDAILPRICVKFSEALKTGSFDYTPFVLVNDKPATALSVQGQSLCIDGAVRGVRNSVIIREALPSATGTRLQEGRNYSFFVRDRSPTLHLSGQKYVLAASGRHGVPVYTMNMSLVDIRVYRVPERGLADFLRDGTFNSSRLYRDLANDSGEPVWTGTLETRNVANTETVTSLPLDEIIRERQPGVYVIEARAHREPRAGGFVEDAYDYTPPDVQWLMVSDLGVTTLSNTLELGVYVRSIASTAPVAEVEVSLVARNNRILGTAITDAEGTAHFASGLLRGTGGDSPAFVAAKTAKGDYALIDLNRSGFDLSDRGVSGREAPGPLDAFVYTDRGIYRPGHTAHFTALLRSDKAMAVTGMPLTLVLSRPDGVEFQRTILQDKGLGSYGQDVRFPVSAMRGEWQATLYADAKNGPVLGSLRVLVDDFIPAQIAFTLGTDAKRLDPVGSTAFEVAAKYLYGAPAAGLAIGGMLNLVPVRLRAAFPGYYFGLDEKNPPSTSTVLSDLGTTDAQGLAHLAITPTEFPQTSQPLEATVTISVTENGGRALEQSQTMPLLAQKPLIGIKPLFSRIGGGEAVSLAKFSVMTLGAGETPVAPDKPLNWELLQVESDFQWIAHGSGWSWEPIEYTKSVATGTVTPGTGAVGSLEVPVTWGRYRLVVQSAETDGPASSYEFDAGWYTPVATADTPDAVQVSLDKPRYRTGETAILKITPRFAGTALVTVVTNQILSMQAVEVPPAGTEVRIPVSDAWTPGTYVTVSLVQPASATEKLPARAVGVAYAGRDESARTLGVKLSAPEKMEPRRDLEAAVDLTGLTPGEQAFVTVAAVDVGVLNVTGFKTPDPEAWFFGQRRLAFMVRDIYGALINGALGETGAIRSGGGGYDEPALSAPEEPIREVVSLYSGIVATNAQGRATVAFKIPQFNGTVRLMAVAWSKSSMGHAGRDVIVRDPVVVTQTMPRFLAAGDKTRLLVEIANLEGPAGDYMLELTASPEVSLASLKQTVTLAAGARKILSIPLTANALGVATISSVLSHPSGLKITGNETFKIRGAQPAVTSRRIVALPPSSLLDLDGSLVADLVPGSAEVTLAISATGALDVVGLLMELDRYPYGCAEQITSRALPLLYLGEVAARVGLADDKAPVRERVQDAIYNVLAKQRSDGSFGLWGPQDDGDLWLSIYVTEFLTRAHEKGFDMPPAALQQALDNLSNMLGANYADRNISAADQAYALYILARNKKASLGDLRYYGDERRSDYNSAGSLAHLGAALALYGDTRLANSLFADAAKFDVTESGHPYYSDVGTIALVTALVGESNPASPLLPGLVNKLAQRQESDRWLSTQDAAWMLLSVHALMQGQEKLRMSLNGKDYTGALLERFRGADLIGTPVSVGNPNSSPVNALVSVSGVPRELQTAGGQGFTISRTWKTMDGQDTNLQNVRRNDRFIVEISVYYTQASQSQILVTDLLPAGFEIDNPALVPSATATTAADGADGADGAGDDSDNSENTGEMQPVHVEFRDDRFVAAYAFGASPRDHAVMRYSVRAVTPGTYALPPAVVEDIYRPAFNARTSGGVLVIQEADAP